MSEKKKGLDGKACWKGYKLAGTKKKGGKTVDNCVKEGKSFSAFCSEAYDKPAEKLKTDRDMFNIPKSEQDAAKERLLAKAKKKVAEQAGDGYIGPPNLNIKNPMASDATRAAGTVKRKADAKARLAAGGKTSGGIANRLQQRADMINSIGEDVEILDVDGNVVADIIDLIKPGPMTGWRQQMAESAWTKKAGKNKEGGLNEKGRKSYEKENPGSDLKRPQPEGGKRKESFCARMSGMRKRQKPENNTGDDRLSLSLKKWNC